MISGGVLAKRENMRKCPWCDHNPHGCDQDTCDFRELEFDDVAILERLKQEATRVGELRDKMIESLKGVDGLEEKEIGELIDLIKAMDIMSKVLMSEFGYDEAMLKKELGVDLKKKMSWAQKMKLMAKIAMMKKTRGKKGV